MEKREEHAVGEYDLQARAELYDDGVSATTLRYEVEPQAGIFGP